MQLESASKAWAGVGSERGDEAEELGLDLLSRLRAGEQSALAEAYDRHHEVIRSFARRLLGDDCAAEDLVHDVFLTLPKAIARFEGRSSLRTFLISVAVNHCRHHIRAATRYRAAKERYARLQRPVTTADPSLHCDRQRKATILARGLDTLPMDQRVAFVLCVVEERTSVEAASIVDAPEETIRTRVHRAKMKLRKFLEEEGVR